MRKLQLKLSLLVIGLMIVMAAPVDAATVYLINDGGTIRSYAGFDASGGSTAFDNISLGSQGTTETTVAAYASYQGFTMTPDGSVYGVAGNGEVNRWNSLTSWLAADAPTTQSTGAYNAGELHGLSYDANTGGFYVTYEGDNSSQNDGDVGQYATLSDFINNTGASVSSATYGGNRLNFYYPDEDAPGNFGSMMSGANYFQVSGSGQLEGWQSLAAYIANSNNRTYEKSNFAPSIIGGFADLTTAIPTPAALPAGLVLLGGMLMRRRSH
ncbi:hypothetical protein HED60_06385 [Planctomycetales bacterium ZRK34]|nr:hypothetical protein HED60_06385 [Planctomycetales bacterium ZRK34]